MLKKKVIALMLCIIVVFATFVGCDSKTESVTTDNSAGEVQQEEPTTEDESIEETREEETDEEEFDWIAEVVDTKNKSESLEKYMRNPDEVKDERFLCAIEAIDVKTNEDGTQIIYGQVFEPYQFEYDYEEYFDDGIQYVFIKYNPAEFDGMRVLKSDIIAFAGLYSTIYSDDINGERNEAPMFEADIRLGFWDYLDVVAMDQLMSSMGQSVQNLGLKYVDENDVVFNELLEKEENTYYREDENISYYKDVNDVYWLLAVQDASSMYDSGIAIYTASKNAQGEYIINYSTTIEFRGMEF